MNFRIWSLNYWKRLVPWLNLQSIALHVFTLLNKIKWSNVLTNIKKIISHSDTEEVVYFIAAFSSVFEMFLWTTCRQVPVTWGLDSARGDQRLGQLDGDGVVPTEEWNQRDHRPLNEEGIKGTTACLNEEGIKGTTTHLNEEGIKKTSSNNAS
jgi:hypothetical protein